MPSEWVEWHRQYRGDERLAKRLRVVQDMIRTALDLSPPGRIRVVSACAGDGRDLLGVLEHHPRAADVDARLVELESELVAVGTERARPFRRVHFVLADAGLSDAYAGATPADLVLVCGVFGNITNDDVRTTIEQLPRLCAPEARVIWTRGRFAPDLTPSIRAWFSELGFSELDFVAIPDTTAAVGAHQLRVAPQPFEAGVRLFTFLPREQRPARVDYLPPS
jgi:hypothetical protein